ncbi:MAG: RNA-binding protein [bacterium]
MEKQKLFVGNLKFETTAEEVKELFSNYGTVVNIRIRPKKGNAFVEMSTPEESAAAISHLDQSTFKERLLRVSQELPRKKARAITRDRFKDDTQKKSTEKKVTPAKGVMRPAGSGE